MSSVCIKLTAHSAFTRTNKTTTAMEVIALQNIHEGEEIFISYLDASSEMDSEERELRLAHWNFRCRCTICASPEMAESNKRRRKIAETKEKLDASKGEAAAILRHVKTLLELYDKEGMNMPKAEYYELAAHASMYVGQRKEALAYATQAKKYWDIIFGENSNESQAVESFVRDLGKRR